MTHKCPDCGKEYDKSARLQRHMLTHSGEKPFACSWEGCALAYSRKDHLQRHMSVHTGERRFVCPKEGCGASFYEQSHWKRHIVWHEQKECKTSTSSGSSAVLPSSSSTSAASKRESSASGQKSNSRSRAASTPSALAAEAASIQARRDAAGSSGRNGLSDATNAPGSASAPASSSFIGHPSASAGIGSAAFPHVSRHHHLSQHSQAPSSINAQDSPHTSVRPVKRKRSSEGLDPAATALLYAKPRPAILSRGRAVSTASSDGAGSLGVRRSKRQAGHSVEVPRGVAAATGISAPGHDGGAAAGGVASSASSAMFTPSGLDRQASESSQQSSSSLPPVQEVDVKVASALMAVASDTEGDDDSSSGDGDAPLPVSRLRSDSVYGQQLLSSVPGLADVLRYTCPAHGCGRTYSSKREVKHHVKECHSGQTFVCPNCGIGIKHWKALLEHTPRCDGLVGVVAGAGQATSSTTARSLLSVAGASEETAGHDGLDGGVDARSFSSSALASTITPSSSSAPLPPASSTAKFSGAPPPDDMSWFLCEALGLPRPADPNRYHDTDDEYGAGAVGAGYEADVDGYAGSGGGAGAGSSLPHHHKSYKPSLAGPKPQHSHQHSSQPAQRRSRVVSFGAASLGVGSVDDGDLDSASHAAGAASSSTAGALHSGAAISYTLHHRLSLDMSPSLIGLGGVELPPLPLGFGLQIPVLPASSAASGGSHGIALDDGLPLHPPTAAMGSQVPGLILRGPDSRKGSVSSADWNLAS